MLHSFPRTVNVFIYLLLILLQEYFNLCPENFRDEDVYVCESRYSAKAKAFKKIKLWTMPISSVRFKPRDLPLPVVRVASVFALKNKEEEEPPAESTEEMKEEDIAICLEKVCYQSCFYKAFAIGQCFFFKHIL